MFGWGSGLPKYRAGGRAGGEGIIIFLFIGYYSLSLQSPVEIKQNGRSAKPGGGVLSLFPHIEKVAD